jgi:peptidoglycan/LPS O-acetylase OafA/YrhL
LAVEEQFYIVLPLLLLAISKTRSGFTSLPYISALLLIGCFSLRIALPQTAAGTLFPLHMRADALFAGVALGYFFHFQREKFNKFSHALLLPIGLALLLPLCYFSIGRDMPDHLSWVLTSNTLGFGFVLCWIITRNVRLPWLERVGFYSYSIYVWHFPVSLVFLVYRQTTVLLTVYLGCSIGLGIYMAKIVELPVLAIRDKYFPTRASASWLPSREAPIGTTRSVTTCG